MRLNAPRTIIALLGVGAALGALGALAGCGTVARTTAAPLPSGSAGSVTVQTDTTVYSVSQPIGVTIHNGGKTTYYAQGGQSECTLIQMQRQVGSTWQAVMPCTSGEQASRAAVTPGLVEPFTLAPGNATDNPNAWVPGVYRFAVQVTASADGKGTATLIYSPGIRIIAPSQ